MATPKHYYPTNEKEMMEEIILYYSIYANQYHNPDQYLSNAINPGVLEK